MKWTRMTGRRRRAAGGFTLIELMIVVIIIAALAAMVAPSLMGRSDDAKIKIARLDISNITLALKMYRLDNNNFPTAQDGGLEALQVRPGTAVDWKGPYLENQPNDPWGHLYQYKYPGTRNAALGFDVYSMGKDGQEGTPDDVWPQ